MNDCERHQELLSSECAGELDSAACERQRVHRLSCSNCLVAFEFASALERLLRAERRSPSAVPPLPPIGLRERTFARLREANPRDAELRNEPCDDLLPALTAWLEGDLEATAHAPLERHLAACVPCTEYVAEARACDRALALAKVPSPPDGLRGRIFAALSRERSDSFSTAAPTRLRRVGLIAAAAALLLSTLLLDRSRSVAPNDANGRGGPVADLRSTPVMQHALDSIARQRNLILRAALDESQPNGVGSITRGAIVPVRGALSTKRSGNAWHRSVQDALLRGTRSEAR